MNKILKIKEAINLAKNIKKSGKTIVIAGGFFDILHPGHIKFLEKAKNCGDYLFVLLEDDFKAKNIKGENRPINSQSNRAKVLSSLQSIDRIVTLKNMTNNSKYDKLITQMKPSIIATTYGDPYISHKKRQSKLTNGKVVCVTKRIPSYSTTKLINLISKQSKKNL